VAFHTIVGKFCWLIVFDVDFDCSCETRKVNGSRVFHQKVLSLNA